jgi:hypothetical protein
MDQHLSRQLNAHGPRGQARTVVLTGQADECPRCHRALVPKIITQILRTEAPDADLEEVCQCTSVHCGGVFVAVFKCERPGHPAYYAFVRSVPAEARSPLIPPEVKAASPVFADVYTQALAAEAASLHQLTGIGLRKALEFLVKDFAILTKGEAEREAISKKPLSSCIADYLSDPSVQAVAKRAAWLGNDETHYIRKWEDKDVQDLKTLIRLTMNGIDNLLLSKKYVDGMPDTSK